MSTYANRTEVSAARSREEIERILQRYGAHGFGYVVTIERCAIEFVTTDRRVRFALLMPSRDQFLFTPKARQRRSPLQVDQAHEQAVRQQWRALALVLKAKLEAIESGITTFDEEFLAHLVLDDGSTVYETIQSDPGRLLNASTLALGSGC